MDGVWPSGRTARACRVVLALQLLPACAHGAEVAAARAEAAESGSRELDGLKAALTLRDQTIQQLEGRLALLEAAQRQLRGELEVERARAALHEDTARDAPPRETVRIGARGRAAAQTQAQPTPAAPSALAEAHEARPLLRLHADHTERAERRAPELVSTWTAPTTTERLSVSPVPALPGARNPAAARASASTVAPPTLTAPAQARTTPDATVGRASVQGASKPARVSTAASDDEDLYVHALDLLRRRELPEALRELDAFVQRSPNDPRLARAQFWRGEILFAERQFARALSAFEQALARDPTGDKAPDALLRVARCHQRLGASAPARAALLELRTQFPGSAAAREAERDPEPVAQEET
jgi:tol-pal system protein YbgF